MPNCDTHFCPLVMTNTLFPICPVEWMLERVDHHPVKDVIFEDEQLVLVFSDGLVITVEEVFQRAEQGKPTLLGFDADECLEAFGGTEMISVAAIPPVERADTLYLELAFQKPTGAMVFITIVEFFSLYSLDQNKPITFFGDFNGPQ